MEHCRLDREVSELLSVDVKDALEDVALRDLDSLSARTHAGHGNEPLGLLRLLSLLGVVRHFEVKPHALGMGDEHIVENTAGEPE